MIQQVSKRYDAYQNSGVDWVSNLPFEWKIYHLKSIVDKKITDGPHETPTFYDHGVPFLSAEAVQNGELDFQKMRGFISEEADRFYSIKCKPRKYDIFIVKSGSTTGKVGYVSTDRRFNIWSPLALVRTNKKHNPRYIYYFLGSSYFQKQVQVSWSLGTQPNIGMGVLENLQVISPALSEQQAIAHYLDEKTAKIDQQIDLLSQKAKHYGELKQALINESVTRGLDKTVSMKDSGIEWIGDIPEHWEVKRLKEIFVESKSKSTTGEEPLLSVSEYTGVTQKQDNIGDDEVISRAESLVGYKICKIGDLVINIMLAWKRGLGVSPFFGIVSPSYAVYSPFKDVYSAFFHHLLRTEDAIAEFKRNSTGIIESRLRLYTDSFYGLSVAVPPFPEQKTIADYLDQKTAQIDVIVEAINTQIKKLKELRKTLINDVVIGKIKVV